MLVALGVVPLNRARNHAAQKNSRMVVPACVAARDEGYIEHLKGSGTVSEEIRDPLVRLLLVGSSDSGGRGQLNPRMRDDLIVHIAGGQNREDLSHSRSSADND